MRKLLLMLIAMMAAGAVLPGCAVRRGSSAASGVEWNKVDYAERMNSFRVDTFDWKQLSFAGKLQLKKPSKHTVSMRVYMVRDSLIHISMRMFGIEGGIIRVTPDSMTIYNKTDNFVTSTSLRNLFGTDDVTLKALQDVILGVYASDMMNGGGFSAHYSLNKNVNCPDRLTVDGKSMVVIVYKKWKEALDRLIPSTVEVSIRLHNGYKYELHVKSSTATMRSQGIRAPQWRVPAKAEFVDFERIVQFLNSAR